MYWRNVRLDVKELRRLWLRPVQAGWDPRFFERYFETPLGGTIRSREEEPVYDFVGAMLEPHHSVLEVGCGTGNYTVPVAQRCAEVLAIDSSPEMLQYLRERLLREGLSNVEVRLEKLPDGLGTKPGGFDGVMIIGVLNYAEDLEESLRALVSVLKPGGWIIFNAPVPTIEGRLYALSELLNRRRAYLLSYEAILDSTTRAGLRVQSTATAGLTRDGLTLVVGATVPNQSSNSVRSSQYP